MKAMTNSIAIPAPATKAQVSTPAEERTLPQLTLGGVLAVWAAAALPMGLLAWFVAPRLANHLSERGRDLKAGMVVITGSVIPTVSIAPGDHVVFTVDGLGDVVMDVS